MSKRTKFVLLFAGLFLFLLFFGLCEAKLWDLDEMQTYLIGLKCYTTNTWPYFGPDVNGIESSFQSQIPGALEGLMIGLPFYLLPIPEAPFIFINLMTAAGAALLAWYIHQRLSKLSFPLLFLWICLTPWVLHKATYVINPAFDFLPSVLFFIGFMETLPAFSMKLVPPVLSNALMGFSVFWIMQFHFSYVYLLPLAAYALWVQIQKTKKPTSVFWFFTGALPMVSLIIPTFFKYGLARSDVASGFVVPFDWYNVREWATILARYFSLVCFELPRFIGDSNVDRMDYLESHPWLSFQGLCLWAAGILQALVMLFCWFKRPLLLPKWKWFPVTAGLVTWAGLMFANGLPFYQVLIIGALLVALGYAKVFSKPLSWLKKPYPVPGWKELKLFLLLVLLMIWVSFWFTIKGPVSHIYLVFYPWLMLYSCYCWNLFADNPGWKMAAKVFLVFALYFQIGHAIVAAPQDSVYIHRDVVLKALREKNYHLMGERRPGSFY
jgi:hypothetical protein